MNYIDRVETDWAFRIQLPIGTNVPFHCTASGKCFLASLAPKKRTTMIEAMDLTAHTKRTHVKKETLLSELKQVSKQGYALDQEEFMDGMVAIAVPVKDNREDLLLHWHFMDQHREYQWKMLWLVKTS